ncbi:MAG: hypothetical protein ABI127_06305 [Dokdonella sp.]
MEWATPPDRTQANAIVDVLLRAWEELIRAAPIERALGLLDAVWPERGRGLWQSLSIGDRDACLFLLKASLFGDEMQTVAPCPHCGERLESRIAVGDVCAPLEHWPEPRDPIEFRHATYEVRFRLPCSEDLSALSIAPVPDASALNRNALPTDSLLGRCVLSAERNGHALTADALPFGIRHRIEQAMSENDPIADMHMAMTCPACGHAWSAALDIVDYLWGELDDWAQDLLSEVHTLARAYAWTECDILAMAPVRRRYYLDLLQG